MKILNKLLFLSISLMTYSYISSMGEEKPGEEKKTKPLELRTLASIASEKLADKALKDYTEAYEKEKNYDKAYQVFTNSLKKIPEEILFDQIYCYLITVLERNDIFIRQLVKEFENSKNDQEKNENVLNFFRKFCIEAQANIIFSIVKEMGKKQLADLQITTLQNLATYLTENLQDKEAISSLEDSLEFLGDELSIFEVEAAPTEDETLKLNFIDELFKILDKKHVISVHEKFVEFPSEVQQKGLELLELYKANNMLKFKNAIKELSNGTKHKILMFYLESYLLSNNNFEVTLNGKTAANPEINYNDGSIIIDLIYYLNPQPSEILLKPEIDETSPSILNDVKGAKNIFANLFKELSLAYPKTVDSIYADIYHFLPLKGEIKDLASLISFILTNYIYWSGSEFNLYSKDKEIKKAADLIIQFYNNVNDTRLFNFLLEELLSVYILPLEEEKLSINHINTFIEILKEIKLRKIFDQSIYNNIIDSLTGYAYEVYNNETLKPKGLTETQLDNLLESLKS